MPADELEDHEGRIEYWEARTATAMVAAEPTTTYHEAPSRGLSGLVREIALARGAEILALGSADLAQFDENAGQKVASKWSGPSRGKPSRLVASSFRRHWKPGCCASTQRLRPPRW